MLKSWLKKELADKFEGMDFGVLVPPDSNLGDYSTNLAFALAKKHKKNPAEVGKNLIEELSNNANLLAKFSRIEFVGPGFINFSIKQEFLHETINQILKEKDGFGDLKIGEDPSTDSTGSPWSFDSELRTVEL